MDADAPQGRVDCLLNEILRNAIEERASDVHIEPFTTLIRLRFRVDGRLRERGTLEPQLLGALLLRLKILSRIPVDCSALPQDGKWLYEGENGAIDVRVSIIPFLHGEGAVLRILTVATATSDPRQLGFDEETAAALQRVIRGNSGLLLVTGPTGCGKSTTIHTLLRGLNDGTRKIITVEDPVEYAADGIQSVQVNESQGLGFADVLRSVLRQTPDVLFVGEIRDEKTAAIAIQAALTGHFVCSTLHCNDAAGAIVRLRQLGIRPHLIAATLRGVLSQRLVRKLCPHCRISRAGGSAAVHNDGRIFHPNGCPRCKFCGYFGQTVLYEWLPLQTQNLLDEKMLHTHLVPDLVTCAHRKVFSGETSPEEIYAVTICDNAAFRFDVGDENGWSMAKSGKDFLL
ncbi:MAG: GspE/PulE family protein [Puniceicoccales bacterium]|jgi:type II secretory ATPase GspE/PulE/Tfp pilus assembly ATPase PilB-like protein|nr:GspE/PulE family protein [Puniceicoccales bacterium]